MKFIWSKYKIQNTAKYWWLDVSYSKILSYDVILSYTRNSTVHTNEDDEDTPPRSEHGPAHPLTPPQPRYHRVLVPIQPVDLNDPATKKFLSRDNIEAESRADDSPEPDNSREVRGMDPHHLHEWIMNVP